MEITPSTGFTVRHRRQRRSLFRLERRLMGLISAFGGFILAVVIVVAAMRMAGNDKASIAFGDSYRDSGDSFAIVGQTTVFGPREELAYVAHIPDGPGADYMQVNFYLRQKNGHLSYISRDPWNVKDPQDTEFANHYSWSDLQSLKLVRPGTYVVRFMRGDTTLVQGTFKRR